MNIDFSAIDNDLQRLPRSKAGSMDIPDDTTAEGEQKEN
jgi:hypothetical protein